MLANLVKIELKELYGDKWADCSFIFRKPKASEMMLVNQEQINLQDINLQREEENKTKLDATQELIEAMELTITQCFISGKFLDIDDNIVDITKEQFAESCLDTQLVMHILPKLVETVGLVNSKPE